MDDSRPPERRWWLSAFLASPHSRWLWLALLVIVVLPPESGLGFELCGFKRLTGGPCPGCGVTRSGSNLFRGNVGRAIDYNPFGLILHPVLIGLCAFSLLPGAVRQVYARRLLPWQRVLNVANIAFWSAFIVFGLVRWIGVMTHAMTFPAEWL